MGPRTFQSEKGSRDLEGDRRHGLPRRFREPERSPSRLGCESSRTGFASSAHMRGRSGRNVISSAECRRRSSHDQGRADDGRVRMQRAPSAARSFGDPLHRSEARLGGSLSGSGERASSISCRHHCGPERLSRVPSQQKKSDPFGRPSPLSSQEIGTTIVVDWLSKILPNASLIARRSSKRARDFRPVAGERGARPTQAGPEPVLAT